MCYQSRNLLYSPFLVVMLLGLLPLFNGCAGNRVKAGDMILLHYTCRLPSGEIATWLTAEIQSLIVGYASASGINLV